VTGDIKAWIQSLIHRAETTTTVRDTAYLSSQLDGSGNPSIGGSAYTGSPVLPPFPRSIKPRHVTVMAANQHARTVTCMTPNAPLFTGAVSTVTLHNGDGTSYTATRNSAEGERRRKMSPGG